MHFNKILIKNKIHKYYHIILILICIFAYLFNPLIAFIMITLFYFEEKHSNNKNDKKNKKSPWNYLIMEAINGIIKNKKFTGDEIIQTYEAVIQFEDKKYLLKISYDNEKIYDKVNFLIK